MLKRLEIENYILIDRLEIEFQPGFSVITGETGAGKSILLGALELILGNRADTRVLLDKERKCTIEGTFDIREYNLKAFFDEEDLDYDENLILRREISPNGKSRAFINDTPVNLNQMKDLGGRLVNIHSQNSTITLNRADFQLAVLDSFAGCTPMTAKFRLKFEQYKSLERNLNDLLAEEERSRTEEDYLRFQLDELQSANLQAEEQQRLEDELNILTHAEDIKENLFSATRALSSGEVNIIGLMAETQALIRKISEYHPLYSEILERLDSNAIEMKDIANEISKAEESTEYNPEELSSIQERLDLLYHLQNKHRVSTVEDLIQIRDNLKIRLEDISSLEETIAATRAAMKKEIATLESIAGELTTSRTDAVSSFEMEIVGLLRHMGMPDACFKVQMEQKEEMTRDGKDRVNFTFSANKGHKLRPLADTASGGELSRVMLGIKAMISQKNLLPTIIFDEIDNGISGDIAGRVGDILLKTSTHMQLIAITHLPQIAGKASVQFSVFKQTHKNRTLSGIIQLTETERVDELAKMISGEEVTEAARQTARELLNQISIFDN
jgi:DNA repair protein RecN (Recombination protein N)